MDPGPQDWASLPKDLLYSVLERLVLPGDYLRFSIVCTSWYSAAKDNKVIRARMTAPMLLIYTGKKDYWKLYDIMVNRFLDLQVRVPNKRLCGSSKDWLIFVDKNVADKTFGVTLINPFFRVRGRREKENSIIRLPPLTPPGWEKWFRRCEYYVYKATMSGDPIQDPNNCIVFVIYMEQSLLAFIKPGKGTAWTYVDASVDSTVRGCRLVEEVTCLEGKFYAVNHWSELISFYVTAESYSNVKLVVPAGFKPNCIIKRYLVETKDKELLMVQRYIEFDDEKYIRVTKKFRFFKLNFNLCKWIEETSLGDFALFLGDNTSEAMMPSKFSSCRPNHIYFNHDRDLFSRYGPHDYGVYNIKEESFSQPYTKQAKNLVKKSNRLPIWVVPSFHL
ncbi:uncharacterized protein LOC133730946 [Rosa rugosa]|uniref:uncharacterized protein LOC133730946 n=1 Tax=Rosa rugosa TaxID=74645 RepID=UPI002B411DBB|nr:uncharacterized protein LOC133730946 [Rosa rugosa]